MEPEEVPEMDEAAAWQALANEAQPPVVKMPRMEQGPLTNMSELNAALGKILRRPLQKGEIMYQVISQRGMGHVASVQLPCLPGEWADLVFTGEACLDKRMAEQAAAGAAL